MSSQPIIRTGIIGMGGRGRYFARNYAGESHPGFELRAVCDRDPKQLDRVRQTYGERVTYYDDMHGIVNDPEIDAILVTTHDPDHVAPTLASLRAGKHTLVEKPLCQTIQDAQQIVDEARRSQGILMIGFELRECTVFQTMRGLLDEGRIGEVLVGHAFDNVSVGGMYYYHDPDQQKAFFKTLLLQKACHSLDLLNWFMGSDPARVYAIGGTAHYGRLEDPDLHCRNCDRAKTCPYYTADRFEMDYGGVMRETPDYCVWSQRMDLNDHSLLCITYANGAKATFHECHFTPEYSREFWFVGSKGKMYGYYDNPGRFLVRIEYSHDPQRHTEEWKPPHPGGGHGGGDDRLRDEFYRRIVQNDPPTEAFHSAYYSTALAIYAEDSIETGQPVAIPPLAEP